MRGGGAGNERKAADEGAVEQGGVGEGGVVVVLSPFVQKLMPYDFFRVHSRYIHFVDNEGENVPTPEYVEAKTHDREWKTRAFRNLCMKINQENFLSYMRIL